VAIHAEGEFTLADLWSGSMLHARTTVMIFAALGIAMLFVATMGVFVRIRSIGSTRDEVALVIVGMFWIMYYPLMIYFRCARNLKSPALQGLVRCDFTPAGYTRETPRTRSEIKWNDIVKWRDGKTSFLLYPTPRSFIVIPKRFFQNSADIDSLRDILKAKIARK
jgi:hypothetical protein